MNERPDRRWVDDEAPDPAAEARSKRKRKRKDADSAKEAAEEAEREAAKEAAGKQPEPESDAPKKAPEGPERVPEPEIRKIAAEAAFRRRIELAELRKSLGEEAYAELRERHGPDMRWYLEEGPLLLQAVVAEVEPEDGPVTKVTVRYAVSRETEPVPPAETIGKVAAAFSESVPPTETADRREAGAPEAAEVRETLETVARKAETLAREMPEEEALELVVDTADRGPVLVSIDRGAVEVHETASEDSPVVVERAVEPEPAPPAETTGVPLETATRIAAEAAAEPLPVHPAPESGESGFARTIEVIERAWAADRMPPIAGGSPELDEPRPAEPDRPDRPDAEPKEIPEEVLEISEEREPKPPLEREPQIPGGLPVPTSEREKPRRPRRPHPSRPRVRFPEHHGRPAEGMPPLPDADTRRRAKRMLRKLAARFGLRLTPDLEGYLMQIVFRLRYVDGRLRRGISVNIDVLIRIMEALREHYPLYSPKRLR